LKRLITPGYTEIGIPLCFILEAEVKFTFNILHGSLEISKLQNSLLDLNFSILGIYSSEKFIPATKNMSKSVHYGN
jgi:hypothetical protein